MNLQLALVIKIRARLYPWDVLLCQHIFSLITPDLQLHMHDSYSPNGVPNFGRLSVAPSQAHWGWPRHNRIWETPGAQMMKSHGFPRIISIFPMCSIVFWRNLRHFTDLIMNKWRFEVFCSFHSSQSCFCQWRQPGLVHHRSGQCGTWHMWFHHWEFHSSNKPKIAQAKLFISKHIHLSNTKWQRIPSPTIKTTRWGQVEYDIQSRILHSSPHRTRPVSVLTQYWKP